MKKLIVYSSLTGNTKKVALAIKEAIADTCECFAVEDAPSPSEFDLIIPGFWVDKGRPDQAMASYLERINNKYVTFFFTLGAYPDSEHADSVAINTETILAAGNNTILGHFRCQGKVDPALIERMKKMLPADHPHAKMTPERKARLKDAAKHPNNDDLKNAQIFIKDVLSNL